MRLIPVFMGHMYQLSNMSSFNALREPLNFWPIKDNRIFNNSEYTLLSRYCAYHHKLSMEIPFDSTTENKFINK